MRDARPCCPSCPYPHHNGGSAHAPPPAWRGHGPLAAALAVAPADTPRFSDGTPPSSMSAAAPTCALSYAHSRPRHAAGVQSPRTTPVRLPLYHHTRRYASLRRFPRRRSGRLPRLCFPGKAALGPAGAHCAASFPIGSLGHPCSDASPPSRHLALRDAGHCALLERLWARVLLCS